MLEAPGISTPEYYIGLLSGTSIDGIDAALFSIDSNGATYSIQLLSSLSYEITPELKQKLNNLIINNNIQLNTLGSLNRELGIVFSDAVLALLDQASIESSLIKAIGFHGQTIYHQPTAPYNFSMQLGDPNSIRERTNIPVITDFRQRDMIHGGQGAPLAPIFHQEFFSHPNVNRAIVNIGGISNITLLTNHNPTETCIASDLGTGNTLMDLWYLQHNPNKYPFDKDGLYAATGQINSNLLEILLSDPYFAKVWPKSSGREYFNLQWLEGYLSQFDDIPPQNIQRTLLELTARVISENISQSIQELYLCGGGAFNAFLLKRIQELLPSIRIVKTSQLGICEAWVEAATFAWLAYCNLHQKKFNLKLITGNKHPETLLGCVYN